MKYIDFNPQAPLGQNTNGVSLVFRILNERDSSWLTQSTDSVLRWACQGGNGYFAAVANGANEEVRDDLGTRGAALGVIASHIAEFVRKDFDLVYSQPSAISGAEECEQVVYKGWRLEQLYRQEGIGPHSETALLDYCLGADGGLYMIASKKDDPNSKVEVFECICYSPALLTNTYCNIYSAAISGVIGVLDAIPIDPKDSRRSVHLDLDDDYYYNFPIQIEDGHTYPYGFLDGVLARMSALLDDDARNACIAKYEVMKDLLTERNDSTKQAVGSQRDGGRVATMPSTRPNVPMPEKAFENYVTIGAKVLRVGGPPSIDDTEAFLNYADSQFLITLVTKRAEVAKAAESRHPEMRAVTELINAHDSAGTFSYETLDEEFDAMIALPTNYIGIDPDITILFVGLFSFLNRGDDINELRDSFLERLSDVLRQGEIYGMANFIVPTIFWFTKYEGFEEKVIDEFKRLETENPSYKTSDISANSEALGAIRQNDGYSSKQTEIVGIEMGGRGPTTVADLNLDDQTTKKSDGGKRILLIGIVALIAVIAIIGVVVGLSSSGSSRTANNPAGVANAKPLSIAEANEASRSVAAGVHSVGLKSDGTVLAAGDNNCGECDVEGWGDIVQVSAGRLHTVGLRADGTVVATGQNDDLQCEVTTWGDIIKVAAGEYMTVGLRSDGTVVLADGNPYHDIDVSGWGGIIDIAGGCDHVIGLQSDGTVIASGDNDYGQCNVSDWNEIVEVAAGFSHSVGLRADGTVVAVGDNYNGQCDVGGWSDIVAISAANDTTIGIRSDRTVVAAGETYNSSWNDTIAVAVGCQNIVGLRSNGDVVVTGIGGKRSMVSEWQDIRIPINDASDSTANEKDYPDEVGILADAEARNSYNLFLSNFTETDMADMDKTSTADATELVRFAISHDGLNSPEHWETSPNGNSTNREKASRIDELISRYMGASINYGDLSNRGTFSRSGEYVYFNRSDVATSPQGVASITGSEVDDSGNIKVFFSVYTGVYDATDQGMYNCSEAELQQKLGVQEPTYRCMAVVRANGANEYTNGLTLLSYKRLS